MNGKNFCPYEVAISGGGVQPGEESGPIAVGDEGWGQAAARKAGGQRLRRAVKRAYIYYRSSSSTS